MRVLLERDGERCIYCRGETADSVKDAHVYPQALRENDYTLPKGVECDACDQFHGSIESALLEHNRIGLFAVIHAIPGKRGRPRRRLRNVERDAEGNLRVMGVAKSARAIDGRLEIEYGDPASVDDRRFRRALGHIALNYVAFRLGGRVALEATFDEIREFVRRGRGSAWPYVQFQYDDARIARPLGLRLIETDTRRIVQIRTYVDDFYVDPSSSDGYLIEWAQRILPRGWLSP